MAFYRLIGIGSGPERNLLACPARLVELAPQDLDQIHLHKNE
jgi:hypothetical protein